MDKHLQDLRAALYDTWVFAPLWEDLEENANIYKKNTKTYTGLVSTILEGKSTTLERKVPHFDGDLRPNISHKNVSYDKKL